MVKLMPPMPSTLRNVLLAVVAVCLSGLAAPPRVLAQNEEWTKPFPPFRMIGNIYWVGSYDLATWAPSTPA